MKNRIIILVNFYNEETIKGFIYHIYVEKKFDVDLLIVDNSLSMEIPHNYPNIILYKPANNLGYIKGFQSAVRKFKLDVLYKYIYLSNSDIEIDNVKFFDELEKSSKTFDRVSCFSCDIINTDNIYQNPFYKTQPNPYKEFITKFVLGNKYLLFIYINYRNKKIKSERKVKMTECVHPYALHGCFIGFKSKYIRYYVNTEFRAFIFFEEYFIAIITKHYNLLNFYNNKLKIKHKDKSTMKSVSLQRRSSYLKESLKACADLRHNLR